MAISSIFSSVQIKDKESAEMFIDALTEAEKQPKRKSVSGIKPTYLTDKEAIRAFFAKK